jgi:hypothetical protein
MDLHPFVIPAVITVMSAFGVVLAYAALITRRPG